MSPLASAPSKVPLWRDIRVLRWAFQIFVLLVVIGFGYWLYSNYQSNIEKSSIQTDLRFLNNPANFTIPGNSLDQSQPVRDAFVQGLLNTLRIAIVGVVLSTIMGTLIGIARLTGNVLVKSLAAAYVEIVRNLPLLLLLTFMNLALVLQAFPDIDEAWAPYGVLVVSNRGVAVPWFEGSPTLLVGVLLVAAAAAWLVAKLRKRHSDATGKPARSLLYGFGAFAIVTVACWLIFGYSLTAPFVDGRGTSGGMRIDPSFFALLIALVVYTSSHIAEIVRGSIQSVSKGQSEAADALALSGSQKMRLVILPQALRVAMPALGNQYLNLIKNSSLGAAISYFELTQIAQITVGNGAPAVPAFSLTLIVYLSISLVTSVFVNYYNRKLAVVER